MQNLNVIDVLQQRGFIEAATAENISQLTKNPIKIYCGFDPTSDSLHLGNFIPMMGLGWFQRFGHTPVIIIGGATGMIGDPSGRNSERQLLDEPTLERNIEGIRKNLGLILDFNHPTASPILLNNLDWFKNFSYISFLREIGKYFRIGTMMAKESVKNRMDTEEGMSYTEFSYQLLQSYDFLHLFDSYGVTYQMGGSDQWGNITAGTELIRKVRGESAYGITFPLLTRSDGKKFGKSERGAIWLSAEKLSPYEFYQYLFRASDADVIRFMKMLTFMDLEEILHYEKLMARDDYISNTAQKRLAEEVTRLVHGESGVAAALRVTQGASPGQNTVLDADSLEALAQEMPHEKALYHDLVGVKLIDFIGHRNLLPSKGEARRLIRNGGVYLNNVRIEDENCLIADEHLIGGRFMLLALGKKHKCLIQLVANPEP